MKVLIAISGCGGGNQGPQGIYPELQKLYENDSLKVLPFDTLPDDVEANVERVSKIASQHLGTGKAIYLMGHSMGGAVAAQAAAELNQGTEKPVKGVVLLNSQTDGLQYLDDLNIPVLFYQGEADDVFPPWQIESTFKYYPGIKKMVKIGGLDHGLSNGNIPASEEFTQSLSKDLYSEVSSFLFNGSCKSIIVSKTISAPLKSRIFGCIANLFRNW